MSLIKRRITLDSKTDQYVRDANLGYSLNNIPKINSRTAVILIDMQRGFRDQFRKENWERLVQNQLKILVYCREHDLPVYLVEVAHMNAGQSQGVTDRRLWNEFVKVPRAGYFFKKSNDAFYNSDIADTLKEWDVDTVFTTGVHTSLCVYATSAGAKKAGFKVITARDVVSDYVFDNVELFTGQTFTHEQYYQREGLLFLRSFKEFFK